MATVTIASSLARWLTPTPSIGVGERSCIAAGGSLREVLESLFTQFPVLRNYITDEHGAMRHHVVAFINGS